MGYHYGNIDDIRDNQIWRPNFQATIRLIAFDSRIMGIPVLQVGSKYKFIPSTLYRSNKQA